MNNSGTGHLQGSDPCESQAQELPQVLRLHDVAPNRSSVPDILCREKQHLSDIFFGQNMRN